MVITTKQGRSGRTTVTLNSGYTFEHFLDLPDLQFKYGAVGNAKESWSPTPGDYESNYVEEFFQTGHNFNNSVTISGGTDKTTAYFSYANTTASGITPENKYQKNNFTFKQSTKMFNDKVTVTSNVILALEETKNRLPSGYYLNPLTGLYMFPRNRNFYDFKNNYQTFSTERNLYQQNWFVADHHQSNPYWIINKEPKTDNSRRVIGSLNIAYDITEELQFQVRGNYDYAVKEFEQQHAATSNGTNVHEKGAWADYRRTGYPKLPPVYQNSSNSDWGIIPAGEAIKRMPFVQSERDNNPAGVADATAKLGGPDEIGTRLWWDTGGPNF